VPASSPPKTEKHEPAAKRPRRRGEDVNGIQPAARKKSTFLSDSDRELPNTLIPSAKMIVLKDMLLDWCKRYPDDKIIGKSRLKLCAMYEYIR
jgi:hypothetical protein